MENTDEAGRNRTKLTKIMVVGMVGMDRGNQMELTEIMVAKMGMGKQILTKVSGEIDDRTQRFLHSSLTFSSTAA